jgi:glucan phosphorylase
MEIAITPAMPTYSGGLGVLAGDTLRAAADMRLPLVAVTLAHRKGYVKQIGDDGAITIRMDGSKDRTVTFNPREMRHFDHGYAVTSHSSQGLTAERVIVNMDTDVHPELISGRFAYVSVSRASHDVQIYTNNAATLGESLSHEVNKPSAVDFGKVQIPIPTQGFDQGDAFKGKGAGLGLSL